MHKQVKIFYILIIILILICGAHLLITFDALGVVGNLQQRVEQLEALNGYAIDKDTTQ